MSKTTPEEAEALANKHGLHLLDSGYRQLAALVDEARGVDAEPFMHVYEFASPFGGTVWRDSPDTWNGNQPKRSLPLYTRPAPSQPAAPVELPVVGEIERGHYGGRARNIGFLRVALYDKAPVMAGDKLVKLSDAQAAIAAGRKAS